MTIAQSTQTIEIADRSFGTDYLSPLRLDVLDYGLFLPGIWLACALGISLRLIGPVFVVIPIGSCLLYGVLRQTVPPRLLSAYTIYIIFIAILSRYQLMPASWQIYFSEEAVIRQLIPSFAFFAVAWASKAYFRRRLLDGDPLVGAPVIFVLSFVVAPAVMFQQGLRYQGDDPASTVLALYGSFINSIMVVTFFITGAIFLTRGWRRYAALGWMLSVALLSHFSQFKVLTAVTLAVLFGVSGRKLLIGLVTLLTLAYAVGVNYIPEALDINPNDGVRLAFVADALESVADTDGIGVGFGKESVRWHYHFPNRSADFTFLPDPRTITPDRLLELLSTGVHNSFVQAMLRTGVVGFVLLLLAIFAAFPPRNLSRDVQNHAAVVFALMFIACFVNPALESPLQAVGIGFLYGYLVALRASVATGRVQAPAAGAMHLRRLHAS